MSGSSAVEIDFFRLRGEASVISPPPKRLSDRRDIQGVISKINPELLKTAIASASANNSFLSNKSCSSPHQQTQTLPVYSQDCGGVKIARSAAPMTIFYNGSVSVFDVSPDVAESIMKLAETGSSGSKLVVESTAVNSKPGPPPSNQNQALGGVLNKDLPLSRKKSLRRFLEKRKERQVSISPYAYSQGNASLR
ncbi:protein TIFY 9 [Cynara cardunculus var. scolymus]|uniref:Protein TIFY n=1 Tax=Cynara cardunculus var. scolymus TaxID=59895 RepID=A0A103XRV3_CYNCS|nr:protein TIFY 9 [Cynara cardunculus var. scolymus]KVH95735.1 CO/COL/TOC1, conserved site-containing protein [Cynara cardunculus var. scolymus]